MKKHHTPGRFLRIIAGLLCLLLGLFSGQASAQPYFNSFYPDDSLAKKLVIPFKATQNLILIPLFLNHSDTLWFILDSGVRNTILFRLPARDSLQLTGSRELQIGGLGMGASIKALHTYGNIIQIPGITGRNQDVLLVRDTTFKIKNRLAVNVHGIIGYALFKDFVVEIDYPGKRLKLYRPSAFKSKGRGRELKLELIDQKPFIQVPVTFSRGKSSLYRLLLDSGAGFSAALFMSEQERKAIGISGVYGTLGYGLSGDMKGHLSRIEALRLGPYTLQNPIIAFPDSLAASKDILPEYHIGIIGMDILKRFQLTISYPHRKIWLKKNRMFRNHFLYNTTGIEIERPFEELPLYMVKEVREGSVAAAAGIRAGDQVLEVNGREAKEMELSELIALFSGRPHKKLRITILRNGEELRFGFRIPDEL